MVFVSLPPSMRRHLLSKDAKGTMTHSERVPTSIDKQFRDSFVVYPSFWYDSNGALLDAALYQSPMHREDGVIIRSSSRFTHGDPFLDEVL